MADSNFLINENKVILKTDGEIPLEAHTLLNSDLFKIVLQKYLENLKEKNSSLLEVIGTHDFEEVLLLLKSLSLRKKEELLNMISFFKDTYLLRQFVEGLYNFWRTHERYLICYSSKNETHELMPYRTFSKTIGLLNDNVRQVYRDICENITGVHERIFRQVPAAFQIGMIVKEMDLNFLPVHLRTTQMIRQIFTEPPLILNPPTNTRTGFFEETQENILENMHINLNDYICYPARVGELIIHVHFHINFIDLGISMANLFDLASEEDLMKKPDAVYFYGVPKDLMEDKTVYMKQDGMYYGFVPLDKKYAYFGYVKKMVLTLHNIIMIKRKRLPVHGAMVCIKFRNKKEINLAIVGDSGAGKSESIEAFRNLAEEYISDIKFIFDDMGSLEICDDCIRAYGTETGAFVRLDDLSPEFAYGNLDRSIIMSPQKVNARAILPVSTIEEILKGYKIQMILYANNYEEISKDKSHLEFITDLNKALSIFREGKRMAKGTTSEKGITTSYFANPFGPYQMQEEHDPIAKKFFTKFFELGIKVGILRTELGINGKEKSGPLNAAKVLFEEIMNN